jgi:hypothetical protein
VRADGFFERLGLPRESIFEGGSMISLQEKRPRRAQLAWLAAFALAIAVVGCGGGNDQAGQAESLTVEQQEGLMDRWNAVAAGVTVVSVVGEFDFKWESFDRFPHPTFKGGSEDAYQKFGDILVALYERDDNFQYMSDNRLFRAKLRYVFPSSAPPFETTFEDVTATLLAQGWIVSDDTRHKLEDFEARIKSAP